MCCFRWNLCSKELVQNVHFSVFVFSRCRRSWTLKMNRSCYRHFNLNIKTLIETYKENHLHYLQWSGRRNRISQNEHVNGRSRCGYTRQFKNGFFFIQNIRILLNKVEKIMVIYWSLTSWVAMCLSKFRLHLNSIGQREHWNGRSFECTTLCCFIRVLSKNRCPHKSHKTFFSP